MTQGRSKEQEQEIVDWIGLVLGEKLPNQPYEDLLVGPTSRIFLIISNTRPFATLDNRFVAVVVDNSKTVI